MAFVNCRECGHEIKADTKQARCENCGSFFPFTCAVCDKYLRPPFEAYDDERYVTDDNKPLCQDHYQRKCPDCGKWFQADENPGYFLCLACSKVREERTVAAKSAMAATAVPNASTTSAKSGPRSKTAKSPKGASQASASNLDSLVMAALGGSAVIGVLYLIFKILSGGG